MSAVLPQVGSPAVSWAERLAAERRARVTELEAELEWTRAELRAVREEAGMLEEWLRKGGGELR